MAELLYSFEQLAAVAITTGSNSVYTVAAGTKVLIKNLHVNNNSGSTKIFAIYVTTGGGDVYYEAAQSIPSGSSYELTPNVVLVATDVLKVNSDGALGVIISGMLEDSNPPA